MAGARSRLSGAVAGLGALALLSAAAVLERLPIAVLAGIVASACVNLLDARPLREVAALSKAQLALAAATCASTLAFAPHVERGVLLGIAPSVVIHLWRELELYVHVERDRGAITLRASGVLWFGNAHRLRDALLEALHEHPDAGEVRLDLAGVGRLDVSAALVLRRLADDAQYAGVHLAAAGVSPAAARHVRRVLPVTRHAPPDDSDMHQ